MFGLFLLQSFLSGVFLFGLLLYSLHGGGVWEKDVRGSAAVNMNVSLLCGFDLSLKHSPRPL